MWLPRPTAEHVKIKQYIFFTTAPIQGVKWEGPAYIIHFNWTLFGPRAHAHLAKNVLYIYIIYYKNIWWPLIILSYWLYKLCRRAKYVGAGSTIICVGTRVYGDSSSSAARSRSISFTVSPRILWYCLPPHILKNYFLHWMLPRRPGCSTADPRDAALAVPRSMKKSSRILPTKTFPKNFQEVHWAASETARRSSQTTGRSNRNIEQKVGS
jgi:hypothetical protein